MTALINHIKHSPTIWVLENFLSERECEDLIFFSEMRGYKEAKVSLPSGEKFIKGLRNNERLAYTDSERALTYWEKLRPYCDNVIDGSRAIGLNEKFRFYKYQEGQRFKRHLDGRVRINAREESRITFMIYLNDDFTGGDTRFDDIVITPKIGSALCFIHEQKHEGCPILEGSKYVLHSDVIYQKPQ